ncbi:MAG TPA: PPC domain-containing DNA-binding protein [Candidatus Limnocylindrales bacterium]|nr:PPC domain-containing DNA-binding protein [Candidatus Limnocylindrales bacterium]
MKTKLLHDQDERTFAVIFDKGDELMSGLLNFARSQKLKASHFTAIGAFSEAILGYFSRESKEYKKIPIREQVEVLSLIGDISLKDGEPKIHAHGVVGKSDGTAHGGHILEARVWPTLEVMIVESPAYLQRKYDEETGLALINI